MNWKFWTWGWELRDAERRVNMLTDALESMYARENELARPISDMIEKCQQPIGKAEEVQRKLTEGLGALSETHPSWEAVKLFIEWQRRGAHVETLAPFTSDREAWVAIGREQGIERVQLALVRAFVEIHSKK
jgi:hypothetical protein